MCLSQVFNKICKKKFKYLCLFNTGFGSSNNGNTARKFFEKSQISSAITGVDENVIHRFAIILTAINTSEAVDAKKFDEYARETAQLLVSKYGWWYMSPTVHKVLLHGGEMISYSILPLGVCELTFCLYVINQYLGFLCRYVVRRSTRALQQKL